MFIHVTYFIFYYYLFISCAVTYKELFLYARASRMVFGMRREILRPDEGPSSPQHRDSDRNLPSSLFWPDGGTVPPWWRRADGTEIPSPERRYTTAEISAILPPGFLDPLPLHLRDPYHTQGPQPQPQPEPEPEEEPEEEEPEEEHDDAAASGTDSKPDDGLQPYDWDGDSDGTDGLDDAVVVDPPYPTRYPAPQEPGGARWRYTPHMTVPSVGPAEVLLPSTLWHPG